MIGITEEIEERIEDIVVDIVKEKRENEIKEIKKNTGKWEYKRKN